MEQRTCDSIISWFENAVRNKEVISPYLFLDAAVSLNVLLGGEDEKLFELEQKVALMKLAELEKQERTNVSEAKLRVEASVEYKQMRMQKAKIDRIVEFVRLAKVHAKIANEEFKGTSL